MDERDRNETTAGRPGEPDVQPNEDGQDAEGHMFLPDTEASRHLSRAREADIAKRAREREARERRR